MSAPPVDNYISAQVYLASRCCPFLAMRLLLHAWRFLRRRGRLTKARRAALRRAITHTKTRMAGWSSN